MRHIFVVFAITCLSTFVVPLPSTGQLVGGTTFTSTGPSGEKFTFEGRELVLPEGSGLLSDAKTRGSGQIFHKQAGHLLLITAEKVASVNPDKIVLQLGDKTWDFHIKKETRFCDGKKTANREAIKGGDTVTVVSKAGTIHVAASVRKGLLLVKIGGMTEAPVPVDFDCEQSKKSFWQFWK